MDYVRNHIIAGGRGGNPAMISVNMEPVRLNKGMEVAVKSIALGNIFNVSDKNKSFELQLDLEMVNWIKAMTGSDEPKAEDDEMSSDEEYEETEETAEETAEETVEETPFFNKKFIINVTKGNYIARKSLCIAVVNEINILIDAINDEHGINVEKCQTQETKDPKNPSTNLIKVTLPSILSIIRTVNEPDDVFTLMGASFNEKSFTFRRGKIENNMQLCFLYLNIVQQSQINGRKSRIVAPFPVRPSEGYTYFEFKDPTYIPIEVRQFSMVALTLLDIKGNVIGIDNHYDTVVTLNFRQNPLHNSVQQL